MYGCTTEHVFFITTTVVDWIDVFTRPIYKDVVVESLIHCQQNKALNIYEWVLMSNHLHIIAGMENEAMISDVIRDFKKFTSKKIISILKEDIKESRREWMLQHFLNAGCSDKKIKNYKFWQTGVYMTELYSKNVYNQKVNYIHNNPVRAGFVTRPEDYFYSSAYTHAYRSGLIALASERPFI